MKSTRFLALPSLFALVGAVACGAHDGAAESSGEEDLTSITARSRDLTFDSYVIVRAGASDAEIFAAVKQQNQSAFGALRTASIGVNSRELKDIDPKTFVKTNVKVIDPSKSNDPGTAMLRVAYRYVDKALVPTTMATESAAHLAVLAGNFENQSQRILTECTKNQKEDKEFEASIWYVFDPSLSQCKTAMATEQQTIDADRATLTDAKTQMPVSELNRLYVPMTVSLAHDNTNDQVSYPEYDRLFNGGVQPGKIVIGMVSGLMADWAAGEKHTTIEDEGWGMWFEGLDAIFTSRPELTNVAIEPTEDLTRFTLPSGKTVSVPGGFADILKWERKGVYPAGVLAAEQTDLRVAAAAKLVKHWVSFEAPLSVKIGTAAAKPLTIRLNSYFGAETDPTPHKRGIKTSDVFIYNGHSYIGYGPLDPSHFTSADFPSSYQIMFINGCVSYNYYEKDYVPLKPGGTANLELVTNGLESYVYGSGAGMGRFVGTLIGGTQASYRDLLKAAQFTDMGYDWGMDALRVVDGELDNKYSPTATPIVVK